MKVERTDVDSFVVIADTGTRYLVLRNGGLCYRTTKHRTQECLRETPRKVIEAITEFVVSE